MVWTWRYEDADGSPVTSGPGTPEAETFPSQSDAETWIGITWRELLDSGVLQVSLLEDDAVAYTMPLTPAEPA
jgi:hypothetical protein